jgi:hypothetical protein
MFCSFLNVIKPQKQPKQNEVEGWLEKRGAATPQWLKRYFIIEDGELKYFLHDPVSLCLFFCVFECLVVCCFVCNNG